MAPKSCSLVFATVGKIFLLDESVTDPDEGKRVYFYRGFSG
jgi:hypothetical protein